MNFMERRRMRKLKKNNQKDVAETVNWFAKQYNACKTEEEKQAFVDSLSPEEKLEINNAAVYIKLQSMIKYASLSQKERESLKEGNLDVL